MALILDQEARTEAMPKKTKRTGWLQRWIEEQCPHIRGLDEKGIGRVKSKRKVWSLGDGIFTSKGSKEGFPGDDEESLIWDQLSLRWKQGLEVGSSRGMLSGMLKREPAYT